MPTNNQLRTIHNGARRVGLIESGKGLQRSEAETRYRLLLRNVGGVESASDLDNPGVEDVMAVLEDMGFDGHPAGKTYWRDKVRARGSFCGARMAFRIRELTDEQRYELAGLCRRFSGDRTYDVERLYPREAWKLIEMLKAVAKRQGLDAAAAEKAAGPGTAQLFTE